MPTMPYKAFAVELEHSEKDYISKRNSKRLFGALIVGLSLLLICGSAAAFAPLALVPVLLLTSKLASIFLGAIAFGRLVNWSLSEGKERQAQEDNTSYWANFINACKLFWQQPLVELRKRASWQNTVETFSALAEAANIGIVLEIVARWIPSFALLAASGPIANLILISDPLIYCFRASIRLTRIVGRNYFNVAFEEEKYATDAELRAQTIGDLFSFTFFSLAVAFFCGVIAPPVGITIAWTMGLCGLSIVGYFDYYLPEQRAFNHLAVLRGSNGSDSDITVKKSGVNAKPGEQPEQALPAAQPSAPFTPLLNNPLQVPPPIILSEVAASVADDSGRRSPGRDGFFGIGSIAEPQGFGSSPAPEQ